MYKSSVEKWLEKLGLANSFLVNFTHKRGDGTASVNVNTVARSLRFNLCATWIRPVTKQEIERCAIHEVCHALLGQMTDIVNRGLKKTLQVAEYEERDEEFVVVTLENFIMREIVSHNMPSIRIIPHSQSRPGVS
jgi:hypothetical protein